MPNTPPIVSTGRGGAGNIGPDPTIYADGGIVREGPQGEAADGAYSTGRGGAGNVASPSPRVQPNQGHDLREDDYIPDISTRPQQENFHTGRGGEGNVYKEKYGGHSSPQGSPKTKPTIGDKVKQALHLDKKREGSPLSQEAEK